MRNGGALLMAEGPEFSTPDGLFYSPLGAIAPAEPTGEDVEAPFRAKVSEEGLEHPVTRGLSGARREKRRRRLGPLVPADRRQADRRRRR